ncbi:MAG: hypothetical protein BLITH_1404 [Brockia lithotrophica]|uniref:Coat F domain-containing protein n=1 Tax=Brockia lithotrophica TaxID=933949 RepID=A0A2T5G6E2_9BACL|nr:MAG: hypothetical protein BLITH_1404 [Brockia lithotrophica]
MVKPPNAITTKDALYLKDILSWELLAVKKCTDFQQHIQDPALKQLFSEIAGMHRRHYDTLLGHLQTQNAAQIQSFQAQTQMTREPQAVR